MPMVPVMVMVMVTVTYEVTALGPFLHQLMRSLGSWAEMHLDDVLANRAAATSSKPAPTEPICQDAKYGFLRRVSGAGAA